MATPAELPPVVRQDLAQLFGACVNVAGKRAAAAPQSPFAALMNHEGQINIRFVFPPSDGDLDYEQEIAVLLTAVRKAADTLRCVVIVESGGDAVLPTVRGFADHRDAPCSYRIFLDWAYSAEGDAVMHQVSLNSMPTSLFRP